RRVGSGRWRSGPSGRAPDGTGRALAGRPVLISIGSTTQESPGRTAVGAAAPFTPGWGPPRGRRTFTARHRGPGKQDPQEQRCSAGPASGAADSGGGGRGRPAAAVRRAVRGPSRRDRKSTRLNSSHVKISYAVFCLKKKRKKNRGGVD